MCADHVVGTKMNEPLNFIASVVGPLYENIENHKQMNMSGIYDHEHDGDAAQNASVKINLTTLTYIIPTEQIK